MWNPTKGKWKAVERSDLRLAEESEEGGQRHKLPGIRRDWGRDAQCRPAVNAPRQAQERGSEASPRVLITRESAFPLLFLLFLSY